MARAHVCPDDYHYSWDRARSPVLEIDDGDTVAFELPEVFGGQLTRDSTVADLGTLDMKRVYALAGPVAVSGAEPGDALEVEVLDVRTRGWGWTATFPGFGLLAEDLPETRLHIWDIPDGDFAHFADVARIPLKPFCGTMGVCPDLEGRHPVMPPGHFGGNLDFRDLTRGASLLLPVQIRSASFSVGDPHAAQGDGEICSSALEAPSSATLRFRLHKDRPIPAPQAVVPPSGLQAGVDGGRYVTLGVSGDLMTAARDAARAMVEHMSRTYGLEVADAYLLASVVVDLRIASIVNKPNWVVAAHLPLGIFA